MKKWFPFLLAAVCIFVLTACDNSEKSSFQSPPALTVVCGASSEQALLGSYSWMTVNSNGTGFSQTACGQHTLSLADELTPISRGTAETASLEFEAAPESVAVRCWSDRYANDQNSFEANYLEPAYDSGTIELPAGGSYIFEVNASWENGDATYSFYIVER